MVLHSPQIRSLTLLAMGSILLLLMGTAVVGAVIWQRSQAESSKEQPLTPEN